MFCFSYMGLQPWHVCILHPLILVLHMLTWYINRSRDMHIAANANFHYWYWTSVGSVGFEYQLEYLIPKSKVDAIREKIKLEQPHSTIFDDTGICTIVCHYDIPLFTCNIDTSREQQKYIVALVLKLCKHLLKNTTLILMYDVSYILDKFCNKVSN